MERLNDDKLRQIEAWLQEAAGMDEASLLKTAADAQRELEQEKRNMTSEEADRMEQKLDLEAYILMARLEENGIRPITIKEYEKRNRGQKRSWCKEKRLKAGMLAAAVVGVALIGGISSIAKSEYRYDQYPGQDNGNALIRYNNVIKFRTDKLGQAYDQIAQKLEIPVIIMDYIPEGMEFCSAEIDGTHMILKFLYNDKYIYLREDNADSERTLSITESDRIDCLKVHNEWLNESISIEENRLENGDVEYSAHVKGKEAFYYFSGVMEKEEFVKIIKNLCYQ